MDAEQQGLVLMLLREGSIHHAAEVFREESGASAAEARRAVYAMARDHGIPVRGSGFLPFVLLAIASLIGCVVAVLVL